MKYVSALLFSFFLAEVCLSADGESAQAVRNVLFIISDDLKASVLGCYGDPVCQTPNIDRLASQGVVFERAYCQGTSCNPSRTSFMHSRYRGGGTTNLGGHFRAQGIYTARVGKIYHMRVPGDIIDGTNGLDIATSWTERFNSPGREAHTPGEYACLNLNVFTTSLEDRQSTRMPHRMFVTVKYEGDGSDQPDHKSATKAVELLEERGRDRFLLAVGFVRPHYPMVAPYQYFAPYPWHKMPEPPAVPNDTDDIPQLGIPGTTNANNSIGKYPDNRRRMWAGYYAAVQFMDQQVGRILDRLETLGLRESTVVVFTSDHGYHLGEHGFWQKSNLHEEVLRVPLIISAPGITPGRTQSFAELVDIFPTVCELAGLNSPDTVQGVSLVPVLRDNAAVVRADALSFHNGHSLRTADWHYMRYRDGTEELYDMGADPSEFHNLAESAAHQATIAEMRLRLQRRLRQLPVQFR